MYGLQIFIILTFVLCMIFFYDFPLSEFPTKKKI